MSKEPGLTEKVRCLVLIALISLAAYSDTFRASWHFDDYPNIVNNKPLHMKGFSIDSIQAALCAKPGAPGTHIYRPVACMSFALNWLYGQDLVIGYHLVNLVIHILCGFFLFLTILGLYNTPAMNRAGCDSRSLFVALFSASLWVANPVQTQAVTYLVQRMASMAAMFYILALFCFIMARNSKPGKNRYFYYSGCALSFFLCVSSKENGVTLPIALLMVELIFFNDKADIKKWVLAGSALAVAGVIGIILVGKNPIDLLRGYTGRGFTLEERLLTQPRVLVFYLSQLFYPIPGRLSIAHDFALSRSLFSPWTTLPAMGLLTVLLISGIALIRKMPLLSFAVLFFFLNHLVESTVLPLEIVFEHRNYLPSMFIFLPVSIGLARGLDYYGKQSGMRFIVAAFMTLLLLSFGWGTYIRNMAWNSERTLWQDAMIKAPGRARPAYNLAKHYYKATGRYDTALKLYERSYHLKAANPRYSRALALNGMAGIFFIRHEYGKVIQFCQRALEIEQGFESAKYNIMLAHQKTGDLEKAVEDLDSLIRTSKENAIYLYLKGVALIRLGRPSKAIGCLKRAVRLAPDNPRALVSMAKAMSLDGKLKKAKWFLNFAVKKFPDYMGGYLLMVENSVRSNDKDGAKRYAGALLSRFSLGAVAKRLSYGNNDFLRPPVSTGLVSPVLREAVRNAGKSFLSPGSTDRTD